VVRFIIDLQRRCLFVAGFGSEAELAANAPAGKPPLDTAATVGRGGVSDPVFLLELAKRDKAQKIVQIGSPVAKSTVAITTAMKVT
jgi:hypothetical protein